ncbi:MAG TPA: acyl-CoA thioester hydrolase/BAAT C-terminal domain-containing protein [Acidimicrobiales bacterium]|nr:acyl-CoA thioester hydrolase/BAAT C-terminal domain-containing protein [Acidimicrobiales bacterium]
MSNNGVNGNTDQSEPWWSMEFASEGIPPVAFTAPPDQLEYQLRAEAGHQVAAAVATRRWLAGAVRGETVVGDGYRLTTFAPHGGQDHPGVLIVPGSVGAAALEPMAALLASHGCATAVLAYIQEPGLPSSLREVPIEALAAGYRAFAASSAVTTDRIAVVAASVATGGTLAMLAHTSDIHPRGLVAISPTHVVWQALGDGGPPPKASSWTLAGAPLPWTPMRGERLLPQMIDHALFDHFRRHPRPKALHLLAAYAAGLSGGTADDPAALAVEQIRCPLLLLSGQDDQMWPSVTMANSIMARRDRTDDQHLSFADAGHFFRPPFTPTTVPWNDSLFSGGTAAGNARAQDEGWQAILNFLNDCLDDIDQNAAGHQGSP